MSDLPRREEIEFRRRPVPAALAIRSRQKRGSMNRLISNFVIAGMAAPCLFGCGGQPLGASFSVTGPVHVSKPGVPYLTYTAVTRAGANPEIVYFMIIKPPKSPDGSQQSSNGESSAIGLNGHAKSKITINGKELTVEYRMTVRPDGPLDTESFTVGGKKQSFDKGRVFLVDLSADPIRIDQHDVKLPTTMPDLRNPMASADFAESTLKELEGNPTIDDFTRPLR
jgi:hypothetical protein